MKYTVEADMSVMIESQFRKGREWIGPGARQKQWNEDKKSVLHQHPQRVSKG